jgi:hypothetical protein
VTARWGEGVVSVSSSLDEVAGDALPQDLP